MLRAILNKSWRQHPTRHQLYGHLPPITKTIQVRRTRHAGHCWRSRDELIRDVLLWTPTHGRAKAGRPARTYIQQLCEDTGCCPEDLPRAMNDREEWRERVRDIRATSTIWWLCDLVASDWLTYCFYWWESINIYWQFVDGRHTQKSALGRCYFLVHRRWSDCILFFRLYSLLSLNHRSSAFFFLKILEFLYLYSHPGRCTDLPHCVLPCVSFVPLA